MRSKGSEHFLHRLTALLTLCVFVFTSVIPSHGALSQAGERFVFTQTDAKNHTTSYTCDNLGRRKTRKLPGNQVESLLYDEVGNLEFRTDFNGTVTKYGYDNLNCRRQRPANGPPAYGEERIGATQWLKTRTVMSLAAGVVAANVAFTYTANGQRETMTDSSGVTTYHYDSRDRLDYKETPQGTPGAEWAVHGRGCGRRRGFGCGFGCGRSRCSITSRTKLPMVSTATVTPAATSISRIRS